MLFLYKNHLKPIIIIIIGLIFDQITKIWVFHHYSFVNGLPNYEKTTQIIGDFVVFRLVYNTGAIFGSHPENIIPFLNPTLFYILIFIVAISSICYFYFKTPIQQKLYRYSLACILTGALGNLIDRIRIQKVIDFIDVDIPNIHLSFLNYSLDRWPVFNIADSFISIGIFLFFLAQFVEYRKNKKNV